MVNNLDIIKPFIKFESEDDFYFIEILKRRKENPDLPKNFIKIKSYYVTSLEELDKLMPEIITICDATNSRGYFYLNSRSFETIAQENLRKLIDVVINKDFMYARKAYDSTCRSFSSKRKQTWIIDFDYEGNGCTPKDTLRFDAIVDKATKLQREGRHKVMIETIPTKNGIHIITHPFNIAKFKSVFSNLEIHKDNPTVLYVP